MRYFIAVAEELNFGKAARRLGISQPPLSMQIQSLEHELGTKLFERSRRHVALTKAGELFFTEAYRLIEQSERLQSMLRRAHKGEVGQLHLAAVGTAFFEILPPILGRFLTEYPEVGLSLRECDTAQAEAALRAGTLDFAFVRLADVAPPLECHPLGDESFMAAIPAKHALARAKTVTLRQLAREPFITIPRRVSPRHFDTVTTAFVNAGETPQVAFEANSLQSKLGFVACGLGFALVPRSVTRLTVAGVVYREIREKIPLVAISLVWSSKKRSTLGDHFLSLIKKIHPDR